MKKIFVLLFIFSAFFQAGYSQLAIQGLTCVTLGGTGSLYQVEKVLVSGKNTVWQITNGYQVGTGASYVSGTGLFSCQIAWLSTPGTVKITVGTSSATLNVTGGSAYSPGVLAKSSFTIPYNTIPENIVASLGSGGACSGGVAFQWQQSGDNSSWSNITGATGSTLIFTWPLTSTMYYRRFDNNGTGGNGYTGTATVNVTPPLTGGGPITPASQDIFTGTAPSPFNPVGSQGGDCGGSYSYQWQYSTDGTNFSPTGTTGPSYPSGALTQTTWFRRMVSCNVETAYTNTVVVNVYPHLTGATLGGGSSPINNNTSPGTLSVSNVNGGMCGGNYQYTWKQSTDNITFTTIPGVSGGSYNPGNLTTTTYYQVVVSCGQESVTTNTYTIDVYQLLQPGGVTPSNQVLPYNGPSPLLSSTGPHGGNNSYGYQWQSSTDGINFNDISQALGSGYTPPIVIGTVYYRVVVSSNGVSLPSTSASITFNPQPTGGSAEDLNYIRTRTIKKPGITNKLTADSLSDINDVGQSTTYFDGLGRSVQTVSKKASPSGYDMVVPQVYDEFGREAKHYLPYVSPSSDGNHKSDPFTEQNVFNTIQFPGEQYYYGRTDFESSPLNRPVANYSAGNSWIGASRGIAMQNQVNTIGDSVQIWHIADASGSLPVDLGVYEGGQLFKNVTIDEQQHSIIEYTDFEGHVVLKKLQLWNNPAGGHSGWLCTYYVYDDFGNLRFVIPPKAVEWLMANSWSFSGTTGSQVSTGLCFRYEYDSRNRMIIKQMPDEGETWTVYDARDRGVMVQDQNHRGTSWVIHKYDNLNREDSMGLLNDANTRDYHQNLAGSSTSYPAISGSGYTPGTRTFYDDYSWLAGTGSGLNSTYATRYSGNSDYFITTPNVGPVYAQPTTSSTATRGLVTGQAISIIGSNMTYRVNFYDDRSRVLQTITNTWPGGRDTTSFQYDFTGKVLRKLVNQNDPAIVGSTIAYTASTKMGYDAMGRLTSTWMRMGGETADHLIDSMKYDELGQLSVKTLGNFLDKQVYEYNIRGWLKGINREYIRGNSQNYFAEELGYDSTGSAAAGKSFQGLQYNGNIAGQVWKSAGDGVNRRYDFSYDNVDRLQDASFLQSNSGADWNKDTIDFSVHNLAYDANGNILKMDQYGFKLGGSGPIDQLTYGYVANSNRLNTVVDAQNDPNSTLGDFHYNSARTGQDYRYDPNGNLGVDKNKGIYGISHNYLNLSEYFQLPGKGSIQITYSADGNKVRKIVWDSVTKHINSTFYNNGFVYTNTDSFVHRPTVIDTLQFLQHAEGRVRLAQHHYTNGTTGYGWEYDFMERDHLGNTRVLLSQEKDTTNYLASMEGQYRQKEDQLFYNIPATVYARSSVMGYPSDTTVTSPNDSVSKVNGNGPKTGPAIILKVMSGDKIDIGVNYYYNNVGATNGQQLSASDIVSSLAMGIVSLSGATHGSFGDLTGGTSPLTLPLNSFLNTQNPNATGKPNAYLNWILLDNQFNYVSSFPQSGALQVGAYGTQSNGKLQFPLAQTGIPITKSGYLYIYVSNATPGWDVFFDNLYVTQYSGPMLEENHYYPFGLTMAGISDKALKTQYVLNKYRYNGKELQNQEFSDGSGLEMYDYGARLQDPQLGRWFSVDPLADNTYHLSPYTYALNNPINTVDLDGRSTNSTHTDSSGNVLAVYNDGDLGVYKHNNANSQADVDALHSPANTSAGGQKMGETEYWDEFLDPDNGKIDKGARILFGQDWQTTLESNTDRAKGMDLKEVAALSTLHGKFDIKNQKDDAPYGMSTGRLLNGKYVTARSAGNYEAGYFGATHPYLGVWISRTSYMKLAGALQTKDWDGTGKWVPFEIMTWGKSFGPPPYYGEIPYSGRMILRGFDQGAKDVDPSKLDPANKE